MDNSERLFGRQTKNDWLHIRERLKSNFENKADWVSATDLMRKRFQTRYFTPIEHILSLNITTGEGFAVVSLMCGLIEFLQSCIEGKTYELYAKETDFVYGSSSSKFKAFLLNEEPFKSIFSRTVSKPDKKLQHFADDFYSNVRCGLLHEAATKNNWVIRTGKKRSKSKLPFVDVANESQKIIYRDLFYYELKNFSEKYLAGIVESADSLRQRSYCRKMDSICEIMNDSKAIWWNP